MIFKRCRKDIQLEASFYPWCGARYEENSTQQLISAELESQTTAIRHVHDEVMAEIREDLQKYITQ